MAAGTQNRGIRTIGVLYLNHDSNMKRVYINSSLPLFAESLCLMAEAVQSGFTTDFAGALASIDRQQSEKN
jgi:hypothetical protein